MLSFWEYVKIAGPFYLATVVVFLLGGLVWADPTGLKLGLSFLGYLGVAVFLYCWECPPRWYCRWKWGYDSYPYYNPKKLTRKQTVIFALLWPLTLSIMIPIITIRDSTLVLRATFDKIKRTL